MNAIVVKADPAELRARRDRALSSVRLTEDELRARVEAGSATPEERDAWQEVDTVAFLLDAVLPYENGADPELRQVTTTASGLTFVVEIGTAKAKEAQVIALLREGRKVAELFVQIRLVADSVDRYPAVDKSKFELRINRNPLLRLDFDRNMHTSRRCAESRPAGRSCAASASAQEVCSTSTARSDSVVAAAGSMAVTPRPSSAGSGGTARSPAPVRPPEGSRRRSRPRSGRHDGPRPSRRRSPGASNRQHQSPRRDVR